MKSTKTGRLARTAFFSSVTAALIAAPLAASAYSFTDKSGKVQMSIGGYAKLSVLYSDTDKGSMSGLARDIYLPSATPVAASGATVQDSQVLDFTARESRINFKGKTDIDGHKVGMTLEIDFLGTSGGTETVSNSYSPRLRHFFFTFDNWLFGQTWSTAMDTAALAESVDFLAAPEGIVFIRQAMARYSRGNFQVALENPQSFVDGATDGDVGVVPDLTGNYKFKGKWGHVRLNGILRQITVDEGTIDESEMGYGFGASGKIKVFANDDIRFSAMYGDGMGRYTSLGLVRDGVLINNKIETVKSTILSAAYRHVWNAKSSSNIILSSADIDNPTGSGGGLNKGSTSIQINYLYRPVKQVTYGIMVLGAERETENGDKGELTRIQGSAKYSF
ncbi:MAG: hypothetical protein JSW45_09800 [Thiotrichales bacterium]|nr:MAG: hypothetical protein JSW45_09800 [Thiotrichales bacterium]